MPQAEKLRDIEDAGRSDLTLRNALLDAAMPPPSGLSPNAVRLAKNAIIDGLGVALAGAHDAAPVRARRALAQLGGGGHSLIWGTTDRSSIADAVFVNSVAEHTLAWDDYTLPMSGHSTAVLLPVCSALADECGSSGLDVLDAFLAGYEINGRLGDLLGGGHYGRGWHSTSTIGVIGAAVSASRLLGLDRETTWNAMGIAASAAGGFQGNFGSMTKSMHAGQAARAGLTASYLARSGVDANASWLVSPTGYLALMGSRTADQLDCPMPADGPADLVIEGEWGLVIKPYSCCGSAQPMIRAIVTLMDDNEIDAVDITAIDVHVDPAVMALLVYERPQSPLEARFCLPYLAAVAALDRAVGPDQFTAAALDRADVARLMSRVTSTADLDNPQSARHRAEVTVRTRDRHFTIVTDVAEGHPSAPMSDVARRRKFDQGALQVLSRDRADQLFLALDSIEALDHWASASQLLEP